MFRAFLESMSCCSVDQRSLCDALFERRKMPVSKKTPVSKDVSPPVDIVDPKIQAVIEQVRLCLPDRKMTQWQLSWCSPEIVQVYLKGRKGDVLAASKILAEALQWREQYKDILSGSRVPVWQSDFRILARAETGHPIIYLCYRHQMFPNVQAIVEHGAYVLEAAVHSMRGDARQFDIIIDCYGFNHTHLDPRPIVPLMKMIQQPYRDRLRTAIFVGAPSAFNLLYRVGSRLVNENTRRKAMFASPEEAVAHVAKTGGGEAARTLKGVLSLNREGMDCQPGEIEGRKMPSEVDDAVSLFQDARRQLGSGPADVHPHAEGSMAEAKVTVPSSRWCCRRRRSQPGETRCANNWQASGFMRLKLVWHALG
mmetsp:Transcript_54227/g.136983  ORF Transcript_54227/g.136983 Transcript_54227/m.136983 type:complete len:367 (-) Transcript_54227:151-1251(-)